MLSFSVLSSGPPCVDILGLISFDILGRDILTFMLTGEYFAEIFHTMLLSGWGGQRLMAGALVS